MVLAHLLGLMLLSVGRWVYEVLISSQGLMQIGWCTINCRFNQEVHAREGALPKRLLSCRHPQSRNSLQSHSGACLIWVAHCGWNMLHFTYGRPAYNPWFWSSLTHPPQTSRAVPF